jgi:hypothetical protein
LDPKTKGEKIQFTKHPTRCCSMQSSIGYKNGSTIEPIMLTGYWIPENLSFVWSWNWERGVGAQIAHKKSQRHNVGGGGRGRPVLGGYQKLGENQPGF